MPASRHVTRVATGLATFLLVPLGVYALPNGVVEYSLYHCEQFTWIQYQQHDSFPSGGASLGTNLWKYEYVIENLGFASGVDKILISFSMDDIDRAQYINVTVPFGWEVLYIPPVPPLYRWSVLWTAADFSFHVTQGTSLSSCSVEFNWTDSSMLPGPQHYELWCGAEYEHGITYSASSGGTGIELTSWGRIKNLFHGRPQN